MSLLMILNPVQCRKRKANYIQKYLPKYFNYGEVKLRRDLNCLHLQTVKVHPQFLESRMPVLNKKSRFFNISPPFVLLNEGQEKALCGMQQSAQKAVQKQVV